MQMNIQIIQCEELKINALTTAGSIFRSPVVENVHIYVLHYFSYVLGGGALCMELLTKQVA